MILLLVYMVMSGLQRLVAWIAAQSAPRLILLFQGLLLLLYLALAVVAAFVLPSEFSAEQAIKIPVSADKVWDHIQDIQKNPVSGSSRVKTRRISAEKWEEEIGSSEIIRVHQKPVEKDDKRHLIRDCWADVVSLKGRITYLLSEKEEGQSNLRLFVIVEATWGSFWTPMLRLLLAFKPDTLEHIMKDYCDQLCQDMGVVSQKVEAWE